MLINYIRKNKTEKSKGVPIGIIVALDKERFGWSLCNPKDKWNKNLGLEIAINRAKYIPRNELLKKIDGYPTFFKVIPFLNNTIAKAQEYFK